MIIFYLYEWLLYVSLKFAALPLTTSIQYTTYCLTFLFKCLCPKVVNRLTSLLTYCLLFSGLLHMKSYRSLFFFFTHVIPLSQSFLCILCLYACVSECVCVCAHTHHLHACVRETWYYQCGSLVQRKWLKWYPELRHQTPEVSWVMVHRSTARTKGAMVKGMEIVEERDRWSRERTSSPGSAANSVWGLRLWGLCQSGSGGKVAPLRKRVERKREWDARGCVGH